MNKEVINIFVGFAVLVITASAVGGLVLSLSITAGAEEVTGDVIINEIMYNPSTEQGPDSDLEWLELYNNDTIPINISGWTIETPSVGTITEDVIMQPEAYVMLARNKTYFEGYYGALPCSVIDVTMGLGNTEDTIVLKDSTGIEIDNVTYIDDWGADGNGKTLERNETGGWAESIVDGGGTPCEENSALWDKEPPMVINATATPSIIAVNAGNTVLHVDVADRDSNINNVTIDLSPIGKSPDTVMTLVGNYMMDELTWLQFEHETNASIAGTFNPKVNATDTYGNYNDTERIELTVLSSSFTINITSPEDRKYASTCVRLNFTVKPEGTALAWIGYSLDGGANVTIAGNTTVGGLSAGGHNIVVYANDTDGNLSVSNIVFFTIHPGDIDFGGKVWIGDVFSLRFAYGSRPGDGNWNENADLNCNSHVWIADVFILRGNYGNEY